MSTDTCLAHRVVVVEDIHDNRHFLESCIESEERLHLVGSFATLQEAQRWFEHQGADLLLVDLGLPDGSGLNLMRQVHRQWPQCDMLVVSMFGDEDNVIASIEAGAVGYVHKDDEAGDIAQTLLAVKNGASPISPMIARHLLRRMRPEAMNPVLPVMPMPAPRAGSHRLGADNEPGLEPGDGLDPVDSPVSLSRREQEVLEYIARGYSYQEIARLQGITVHTVQTYIKKLYGKLAVHSRSEAVYEANRLGLLQAFNAGLGPGQAPKR